MVSSTLRTDREIRTDEVMYVHKDVVAYNIVYYGRTDFFIPDASDSAPIWQIKRVTSVAGIQTTEFAQVGKYKCKWTDRYTYFSPDPPAEADPGIIVTSTVSGLTIAGRVTLVTLNALTWTALPDIPQLALRNAIRIQNQSATEIRLNYDPLIPGYEGVWVKPNGETYYDIRTIPIYAKAAAGTPVIAVEEIS